MEIMFFRGTSLVFYMSQTSLEAIGNTPTFLTWLTSGMSQQFLVTLNTVNNVGLTDKLVSYSFVTLNTSYSSVRLMKNLKH